MDCKQAHNLMAAYLDDELDPSSMLGFSAHLAQCQACNAAYQQMAAVSTTLKTHATRHVAPSHLRHRIQSALPRPQTQAAKQHRLPWGWINFGVAAVFSFAFAVTLSMYWALPSEQQRFEQEIVASHARSLMVSHLADVASSDRHTVKPWFSGKLDFSPPVLDLAAQGFPLIGGRLDYLNRRTVAALAYGHRQHVVNLFVWPDTSSDITPSASAPHSSSLQGYQLIQWHQAGMRLWAVSDMNLPDLRAFQTLLTAQIEKDGRS